MDLRVQLAMENVALTTGLVQIRLAPGMILHQTTPMQIALVDSPLVHHQINGSKPSTEDLVLLKILAALNITHFVICLCMGDLHVKAHLGSEQIFAHIFDQTIVMIIAQMEIIVLAV